MALELSSSALPAHGSDSITDKVYRELNLLGGGLSDGLGLGLDHAKKNWQETALTFAASATMAAGLAYVQSRAGGMQLAVQAGALALAVPFFKDVVGRAGTIGSAMADTWHSSAHFDANQAKIASAAGPFLVDLGAATAGGAFGLSLGLGTRGAAAEATLSLRNRFSNLGSTMDGITIGGRQMAAAPLLDAGSELSKPFSALNFERSAAIGSDAIATAEGLGGATAENFYLRGKVGADGVWQPVRDIHELPLAGKRQLVGMFADGASPLLERKNVDAFVGSMSGVLDRFTPLPANAPEAEVVARGKQLLDAINAFNKERSLPRLKLSITDAEKETALISGKMLFDRADGYIGLQRVDLLQNPALGSAPKDMLIGRLYHEVNHGQQVYDIFDNAASLMKLPRVGRPGPYDLLELKESINSHLGNIQMSDSYFERLLDTYKNSEAGVQHPKRAINLMRGFIMSREPGPEYGRAVGQIEESVKALQQLDTTGGAHSVLQSLQSPQRQQAIFGSTSAVPEPVRTMVGSGSGLGAESETVLGQSFIDNINGLNTLRRDRYARYMGFHEIESWLVQQKALIQARKLGV